MAPRKKAGTPASAPMSALAARKAREEALANGSEGDPSTLGNGEAAPTSRLSRRQSENADATVEVPTTASHPVASDSTLASSSSARTSSSTLKRSRRSSTAPDPTSIAVTRPKRNSNSSSAQLPPDSTPSKATKATLSDRSCRTQSSTQTTPAGRNRGKDRQISDAEDIENDMNSDHDIQQILSEFGREAARSDIEASGSEQPPPKKRAKQPSHPRPPVNDPKKMPINRTHMDATPEVKMSSKNVALTKLASKEMHSEESSTSQHKAQQLVQRKPTEQQVRTRGAKRYFADKSHLRGESHIDSSAMPIEDEVTGFLAFGHEEDDEDQSIEANGVPDVDPKVDKKAKDMQSDLESHDSSEDEEQQGPTAAGDNGKKPNTRSVNRSRHRADPNGNGHQTSRAHVTTNHALVNQHEQDDDSVDDGHLQIGAPALTRAALLNAIPYSNFTPILDGKLKNTIVVENKRKRGREALYFGLRNGETLVFLGIGHVEILQGSAQVGGAVLSPATHGFKAANIFAPISNPLPVLKSVSTSHYPGQGMASADSLSSNADKNSDTYVDELLDAAFDTVVKVTPFASPITALGQVCPIGGLATPFSAPPSLELSNKVHHLAGIKVLFEPSIEEIAQKPKNLLADGTFSTMGLSAAYIPHKWQASLHHLSAAALSAAQHPQEESVVALIRGNKKVGKSTLSRMALERLLSMGKNIGAKVAYLELDLGQSDFGPPGMVALHVFSLSDNVQSDPVGEEADAVTAISQSQPQDTVDTEESIAVPKSNGVRSVRSVISLGPGWCQPRVPVRAHFIGDVSPRDDPESYVAAVHDLMDFFRARIQPGEPNENGGSHRVPIVINTQGWIKGLGADLAARIVPILRPTHIFDVIPRGSPDPIPPPTRGHPWLDVEGAILGAGPEIVTLESVSQLEFVQGSFGGGDKRSDTGGKQLNGTSETNEENDSLGDGGSEPPRYITEVGSKLAPAEARLLNVMSYLYATQLAPAEPDHALQVRGSWDLSEPLVHRRPLVVNVAQGLKAGIRVMALGSSVPDSLKLFALNSSIVAIVIRECDAAQDADAPQDVHGNIKAQKEHDVASPWKQAFDRAAQIAPSGLKSSTRCIGLGIVRSIDADAGHVHLLSPLDPAFLHRIEASTGASIGLVKGALELPVWASLNFEAIQEARESRLDVPPAAQHSTANGDDQQQQQLLAGMPRNQVPYLEWPHSANQNYKRKHLATNSLGSMSSGTSTVQLGSEKRRIRRNLMRKSQFV